MNKCHCILIAFAMFLIISCDFKQGVTFNNDMDQQYNFSDCRPRNLVLNELAKSGKIVCCLEANNPYSPAINKTKNEISNNNFDKIIVGGFFLVKSKNTKPTFVVDFRDSLDQNIGLLGKSFEDFGRINEWVYCEFEVTTKEIDSLNRAFIYRVYAHNPGQDTFLLDDLCVEFK